MKSPGYTGDSPSFDEGQEEYTKGVKKALEDKREEFEADTASSEYAE